MGVNEDKIAKAKVIEGMLQELDMSKQELIDLIKSLMEQSISEEKGENISQDASEVKLKSSNDGIDGNLTLDQLAEKLASGDAKYLEKYLTVEQIKNLSIRVGFAQSLKRAKQLGIILDTDKLAALIGLNSINELSLEGKAQLDNKQQTKLPADKLEKLTNNINALVNQRQMAASQNLSAQERNQLSQITNDPNDLSNQNSSVNVVRKVASFLSMQMQSLGLSGGSLVMGSSVSAQQQQQQTQQQQLRQMQQTARRMQQINSQIRKHQRELKKMFPELDKVSTKKGQVTATVRTKSGEREVNLKDYLRENGKLTSKAEKLIDGFSQAGSKLEQGIDQLSKGLPKAASFQFDASGRMQVAVEEDKKSKIYNIADYINDLNRDIERQKTKLETKKSELESKKTELENKSNTERAKDLSRGPELDKSNTDVNKLEANRLEMLKYSQTISSKDEGVSAKTEKTESKRMSDELVKLDALHDKEKMLQSMKNNPEMKAIESSMKDVMKNMEEAQKNKDMLDNLKKDMSKGKFIDKG